VANAAREVCARGSTPKSPSQSRRGAETFAGWRRTGGGAERCRTRRHELRSVSAVLAAGRGWSRSLDAKTSPTLRRRSRHGARFGGSRRGLKNALAGLHGFARARI
jgi:hypothetical protein